MFLYYYLTVALSKVIYVSPSGSDSNSGLSATIPLLSLTSATAALVSGDTLLLHTDAGKFEAGNNYLNLQSLSDVLVDSYGALTDAVAVVSGAYTLQAGAFQLSGDTYAAPLPTALAASDVIDVFHGDTKRLRRAQTPLLYAGVGSNHTHLCGAPVQSALAAGMSTFVGASAIAMAEKWAWEMRVIDERVGDCVRFASSMSYGARDQWRASIEGDASLLDEPDEWYARGVDNQLLLKSFPSSSISIVVTNVGLTIRSGRNVTIRNLHFEYFATRAIEIATSNGVMLDSIRVSKASGDGIYVGYSAFIDVTRSVVSDVLANGMTMRVCSDSSVRRSLFQNISLHYGRGQSGPGPAGISTDGLTQRIVIEECVVKRVAHAGIRCDGVFNVVRRCYVSHACMMLDDCGGINSWSQFSMAQRIQRGEQAMHTTSRVEHLRIEECVVSDTFGRTHTSPALSPFRFSVGIYIDNYCHNVTLRGNLAQRCSGPCLFIHNSDSASVIDNVALYSHQPSSFLHSAAPLILTNNNLAYEGALSNATVEGNLLVTSYRRQLALALLSSHVQLPIDFGTFDHNTHVVLSTNRRSVLFNTHVLDGEGVTIDEFRALAPGRVGIECLEWSLDWRDIVGADVEDATERVVNGAFDVNLAHFWQWGGSLGESLVITWTPPGHANATVVGAAHGIGSLFTAQPDAFNVSADEYYTLRTTFELRGTSGAAPQGVHARAFTQMRQSEAPYSVDIFDASLRPHSVVLRMNEPVTVLQYVLALVDEPKVRVEVLIDTSLNVHDVLFDNISVHRVATPHANVRQLSAEHRTWAVANVGDVARVLVAPLPWRMLAHGNVLSAFETPLNASENSYVVAPRRAVVLVLAPNLSPLAERVPPNETCDETYCNAQGRCVGSVADSSIACACLAPFWGTTCCITLQPNVIASTCTETTVEPSMPPTLSPTTNPTLNPTNSPTKYPTFSPTHSPTISPTTLPTNYPTSFPVPLPTTIPSNSPSNSPSKSPTSIPTDLPSTWPTNLPTTLPTPNPTDLPTHFPSLNPTVVPTKSPSNHPSNLPTSWPTASPFIGTSFPTQPTQLPTSNPTTSPSTQPTLFPSMNPTKSPNTSPTLSPTSFPSSSPLTQIPTSNPTQSLSPSTTSPTFQPITSTTALPTPLPSSSAPLPSPTTSPFPPLFVFDTSNSTTLATQLLLALILLLCYVCICVCTLALRRRNRKRRFEGALPRSSALSMRRTRSSLSFGSRSVVGASRRQSTNASRRPSGTYNPLSLT